MTTKKTFSILIADDCAEDQFLYQTALSEIAPHINMNFVYNGFQLLEYLEDQHIKNAVKGYNIPDAVIVDVNMPFVNGIDALKKIKSNPQTVNLPVYLISGSSINELKVLLTELGAAQIHEKPYTYQELCTLLSGIVDEIAA